MVKLGEGGSLKADRPIAGLLVPKSHIVTAKEKFLKEMKSATLLNT